MPVQKKKLKVLPNPWTYIDHTGRPAGHVKVEQPNRGFDPRAVGSRIADDPVLTSAAQKGVPLAQDVHEIEREYSKEPVEVPNTDYYRRCVINGDLIAADRETFVACGGRPKAFEAHQKHLDDKKTEAITRFDVDNGEGAFKQLAADRAEAAALKAKVAEAVKAAADDGDPEPSAAPTPATEPTSKASDSKKGGAQ